MKRTKRELSTLGSVKTGKGTEKELNEFCRRKAHSNKAPVHGDGKRLGDGRNENSADKRARNDARELVVVILEREG
jgi:hypothetical protein